ncbi:hypothetical protein ACHAWF_008536 [Thalassiosira exigua]
MSTPVVTNRWAGTFDCGTCGRKRLMGEEFSKKALERHRKNGLPLKCKQCVSAAEQDEREKACSRRDAANNDNNETRKCAGKCNKMLSQSAFNRNQWSKGEGKSRCRVCVEQSIKDESTHQTKSKEEKLITARKNVKDAKATGDAQRIIAAESELSALEAERVTGLKPVKLSSTGRGRGARSGRFGGRGRGGKR